MPYLWRFQPTADLFCQKYIQYPKEKYNPDYWIMDKLVYDDVGMLSCFDGKAVEMGNAKYDDIYAACVEKCFKYPFGWDKLHNTKKKILYTSTHGIYNGKPIDGLAFDLYIKDLFTYAKEHLDIGIIIRLHSVLIRELISNGYWSTDDEEQFIKYCESAENIVYDKTNDYKIAISVSDALITDAYSGMTCSYLPSMKPIAVLYRYQDEKCEEEKRVTKSLYHIHNKEELYEFINYVEKGYDPLLNNRDEICKQYIPTFDGKNGLRIKEFIEQKLDEGGKN